MHRRDRPQNRHQADHHTIGQHDRDHARRQLRFSTKIRATDPAIGSAAISPNTVIPDNTSTSSVTVAEANRFAASGPPPSASLLCQLKSEYAGTNTAVSAPSPKIRRNRFGN